MTEAKPLSAEEIAQLKHNLYGPRTKEIVSRLIATIEQQQEQIEKLRRFALDVTRDPLNAKYELAREALAATEPQP